MRTFAPPGAVLTVAGQAATEVGAVGVGAGGLQPAHIRVLHALVDVLGAGRARPAGLAPTSGHVVTAQAVTAAQAGLVAARTVVQPCMDTRHTVYFSPGHDTHSVLQPWSRHTQCTSALVTTHTVYFSLGHETHRSALVTTHTAYFSPGHDTNSYSPDRTSALVVRQTVMVAGHDTNSYGCRTRHKQLRLQDTTQTVKVAGHDTNSYGCMYFSPGHEANI